MKPRLHYVAEVLLLAHLSHGNASYQEIRATVPGIPQDGPPLSRWLHRLALKGLIIGHYQGRNHGPGRTRVWSLTEAGTSALAEVRALLDRAVEAGLDL